MTTEWMQTSRSLPADGDHVQFVLENRDLAMNGVYDRRMFASRWSEYEPGAVREWRQLVTHAHAEAVLEAVRCDEEPATTLRFAVG